VLGGTGYVTMDPENIEAVLSSRVQGTLKFQLWIQALDTKSLLTSTSDIEVWP
jgi:hypothetical protein